MKRSPRGTGLRRRRERVHIVNTEQWHKHGECEKNKIKRDVCHWTKRYPNEHLRVERIRRAEESEQNPDEQLAMTKIYPRRNLRGSSWRKKLGVKLLLKEKSMRALAVIPGLCSLSNMLSSHRQEFHQKMNVGRQSDNLINLHARGGMSIFNTCK